MFSRNSIHFTTSLYFLYNYIKYYSIIRMNAFGIDLIRTPPLRRLRYGREYFRQELLLARKYARKKPRAVFTEAIRQGPAHGIRATEQ